MTAALPPPVKHAIAVGHMSKGRVVKGIEQTWCRASKSARGDGKFAASKVATPLQYASAGDSPPTTLPLPLLCAAQQAGWLSVQNASSLI